MDLEEILALKNSHIRSKEAEARGILAAWAGPVSETLERLKRQFGVFLPIQDMGRLISPTEEANYRLGKTQSTRLLFDAYAETVFGVISEPEEFIALLGPIRERVQLTLTVIDKHEAELRELDWHRPAWKRQESLSSHTASVLTRTWANGIRKAWSRMKAFWAPNPVLADASKVVDTPDSVAGIKPSPSEAASDPLPTTGGAPAQTAVIQNGSPGVDRSAKVDDFLVRCNQEPGLPERLYKKHIWASVGHKSPRQFQYWQAGDAAATAEDEKNFGRILAMSPSAFIAQLKRSNLISDKS